MDARVKLTTETNGNKNEMSAPCELELSPVGYSVCFSDESGTTKITFTKEQIEITKKGTYAMRLRLVEGQRTKGSLGLAGNTGELDIFTKKISVTATDSSLCARLAYTLIFPTDKQEVSVVMNARKTVHNV